MYKKWQEHWDIEPTCRQTKQFFDIIMPTRSKKILNLARSQLSTLIPIITGHNNLAYHEHVQDVHIDPLCRLCDEEAETFYHFINNCPRLRQLRQEIFQNRPIEGTDSWAIGRILELARVPAINVLLFPA